MTFKWVRREVVDIIHEQQLAAHGGLSGIKDENALEAALALPQNALVAALARPQNKAAYGETDPAALAAAYAFGIAKAHPFHDGNKRMAFLVSAIFLRLNDFAFQPSQHDVVLTIRALAGEGGFSMTETVLADWFRKHIEHTTAEPGSK